MSKHTLGPWHTEERHTVIAVCCTPTRRGEYAEICFQERDGHPEHGCITGRMRTSEELHANARLIAAAPDLLEALKALLWQHDNNGGQLCGMALQDARAAVAKALG